VVNNTWLDIDVLEDYLDGKLDAKGMHFVERQALDDPFVAEAIEGLRQSPKRKATLSILQKQLHDRLAEKPIKRKLWGINTQRLSIAATATVAFIAVSTLFLMRETKRRNEVSNRRANGVVVTLGDSAAVASTSPVVADTQTKPSAVIDKAIAEAKKGDYAVNQSKKEKKIFVPPVVVQESNETVAMSKAPMAKIQQRSIPASAPALASVENVSANRIVGEIVENGTNNPIPGASVKIKGTNLAVISDQEGKFDLKTDSLPEKAVLEISSIGYKTELANLSSGKNLKVNLKPNNSALSEVVVVGYGNVAAKKAKSSYSVSFPDNQAKSTQNLDKYLAKNNQLLKIQSSGNVVELSFNVDKDGKAYNIELVKPFTGAENEEAIRLVKDAPKWIVPAKINDKVYIKIKF
jgi:hypothetical protein